MSPALIPEPARGAARCPCGAPVAPRHQPFCSQGCRDRDLLRWLSEGYRLPVPPEQAEAEESDAPALDTDARHTL